MSNSLDPDYVGPDLGPSCLQRLPAEDTINRQRATIEQEVRERACDILFLHY